MSLILEHGADVNSKGGNETTALMVAATLGHNTVLSIMLAHPLLNIQAGVSFIIPPAKFFSCLFRVLLVTQHCSVPQQPGGARQSNYF